MATPSHSAQPSQYIEFMEAGKVWSKEDRHVVVAIENNYPAFPTALYWDSLQPSVSNLCRHTGLVAASIVTQTLADCWLFLLVAPTYSHSASGRDKGGKPRRDFGNAHIDISLYLDLSLSLSGGGETRDGMREEQKGCASVVQMGGRVRRETGTKVLPLVF